MVRHSRVLQVVLAVDMAALLAYNVAGMAVTGHLGAVFRTVLETMRTLFVWLVGGRGWRVAGGEKVLASRKCRSGRSYGT